MLILIVLLILVSTYIFLPESRKPDPNFSLKPLPILRNFASVLKNPQFMTCALTGSIAAAGLYAYISGSAYVFMEIFGVSDKVFGWIFAFIAAGLISASQVNSIMLKKYASEHIVRIASTCQSIIGAVLLAFTLMGWLNLYLAIFLVFLFLASQGFIFPNTTALALAPMGHNAEMHRHCWRYPDDNPDVLSTGEVHCITIRPCQWPVCDVFAITALLVFSYGKISYPAG
jgi:DHA1 family bicyclomycin/chloramphenicol resistance-like MFS transporter